MKPLSDRALARLRDASELPDLSATRYSMIRELGRGGMGIVYLVEDAVLGRQAALKVLHHDDISADLAERMRREARTLAQLEHPGIVPIYDFGDLPGNRLYYVMRYIQGQRLDEIAATSTPLPDRLRLFEKICEAVGFAHSRGVIHRDLKPANIILGSFGEVLVLDWGLARLTAEAEPGGRRMGTEGYMAPEQSNGDAALDHRADIFSLGRILLYLAGDQPPKPIRSIVVKATAITPEERYPTAIELSADVLRFLDGLAVSAHQETLFERLRRFYSRNRTVLLLALSYVIMRFLIFFWLGR